MSPRQCHRDACSLEPTDKGTTIEPGNPTETMRSFRYFFVSSMAPKEARSYVERSYFIVDVAWEG